MSREFQTEKKSPQSQIAAGLLQRLSTNANEHEPETVPPIVHEVLRSPGKPLDQDTRAFFEPRFGHDFSHVRVHHDTQAAESARAVDALAYTVGRNIVFAPGQYTPETSDGKRLLSHELTHVVQQGQSDDPIQCRVQRWFANDHVKLTSDVISRFMQAFPDFQLDERVLHTLARYAGDMDNKIAEVAFNIGGKFTFSHQGLVGHYRAHQESALNHGEGGLYSLAEPEAARLNKAHQLR